MFNQRKKIAKTSLIVAIISVFAVQSANRASIKIVKCGNGGKYSELIVPEEYTEKYADKGICVFQKDNYTVFLADLKAGVEIDFLIGRKLSNTYSMGADGDHFNNMLLEKKPITYFYNRHNYIKSRVVINAAFFGEEYDPYTKKLRGTFLSFPTQTVGYSPISSGVDMRLDADMKVDAGPDKTSDFRTIIFDRDNTVYIKQFNRSDRRDSRKLIVSLRGDYNKTHRGLSLNSRVGRTFAGVRTGDTSPFNGKYTFFVMVVSPNAYPGDMRAVLSRWFVEPSNMVMFVGGGSSQFMYPNGSLRGDSRPLPMVIEFRGR